MWHSQQSPPAVILATVQKNCFTILVFFMIFFFSLVDSGAWVIPCIHIIVKRQNINNKGGKMAFVKFAAETQEEPTEIAALYVETHEDCLICHRNVEHVLYGIMIGDCSLCCDQLVLKRFISMGDYM
ncbi:unnamed protein product [Macrosiphum euphorbiae]|uniref:Uncharacterized protein n=1 Tax=Macrosiphum euphorbiae TaxID=13131 RepID=A0AAV0XM97_9HEMI|nr:unnamed protein product [Macrosiphum euphorbiae]